MEDEISNALNLDLNLGRVNPSNNETEPELRSLTHEAVNLEDWIDGRFDRLRQLVRQRTQVWRSAWRQLQVHPDATTRNIALELMGGSDLQVGEGSVAAEISASAETKICDKIDGCLGDEVFEKKDKEGKANGTAGSCFDCNICLDLAKDPVVTCCGHLFCWTCLYKWLHLHSDAMECPVCKGEVKLKNVTPIFGRGSFDCQPEDDINLKIPPRPQARRFDSSRQAFERSVFSIPVEEMIRPNNSFNLSSQVQPPNAVAPPPQVSQERIDSSRPAFQRSVFSIPVEEMIRQLNNSFDLSSQVQPPNAVAPPPLPPVSHERSNSLLDRILTSRRMGRAQNIVISPGDVVDLIDTGENHQIPSILPRRSNSNRAATISHLTSALSLVESYSQSQPIVRNQDHHPVAVEDRDVISPGDVVDLTDAGESQQTLSFHLQRSNSNRAATISHLTSALSSAERLVESYFQGQPILRNQDHHLQAVEDRDSMSSIAAFIQSESQTVDTTTIEIDSTVSLSTSSSRRRDDASIISDNDSGDSRAARRRRLD